MESSGKINELPCKIFLRRIENNLFWNTCNYDSKETANCTGIERETITPKAINSVILCGNLHDKIRKRILIVTEAGCIRIFLGCFCYGESVVYIYKVELYV